jgi:hypothetical protein
MSLSTFVMLTAVGLLAMAWYANTSKRNKILCRYRRVNKTLITKFVSMDKKDPHHVVFDGGRFNIVPSSIVFQWYTGGFIHMVFPIFVPTLDFTYESRWPLDPNTLKPAIISPAVRKSLNKEEWVKSYAKGFTPPGNKKQSLLQGYLPWIALGIAVLGIFWMYNNITALANTVASLQNAISAIPK